MKSRARKRPRVPTNPVAATALKVDPTRTLTLRRGVCTEASKRLAKVRLQIHDLLVRQQALRFRWATLPTEGKVAAVTNWVTTLLREALLPSGNWWAGKLLAAYMRGASRSHDDVRRRNPQLAALGAGGKGEFLRGLVRRRALPRPVTNAYNPDQPRGEHTGRWVKLSDATVGQPRDKPLRGHDHPDLEMLQASEGAKDATDRAAEATLALLKYRFPNDADLRREYWESMFLGIETFAPWQRQQYPVSIRRGAKHTLERSVQTQAGMAAGNVRQAMYEGRTSGVAASQHTLAKDYHDYLARAISHQGRMWLVSSIKDHNVKERVNKRLDEVVKRHQEAAALHHDAAEMLGNPHLTLRQFTTNATPYVSPDDVETYGGRLQALAHRLRNELDGVTWAAAQRIARVLHDGLDQGWGAERLAQALTDVVDSLVRSRALLVANNELIRAHADGQLDALEELGEEEVTAAVEWVTAGDDRVCKLCKPLDGVVLTVAEARGLIPRHVNCRCAWLPAGTRKGQEGKVMRSTLQDVTRAVKRSLRKAPANDGWFEGKAVARKRPKV
jgi:SPP1 gp7 family putative phage head morphogenesis protein